MHALALSRDVDLEPACCQHGNGAHRDIQLNESVFLVTCACCKLFMLIFSRFSSLLQNLFVLLSTRHKINVSLMACYLLQSVHYKVHLHLNLFEIYFGCTQNLLNIGRFSFSVQLFGGRFHTLMSIRLKMNLSQLYVSN